MGHRDRRVGWRRRHRDRLGAHIAERHCRDVGPRRKDELSPVKHQLVHFVSGNVITPISAFVVPVRVRRKAPFEKGTKLLGADLSALWIGRAFSSDT